MDSTTPFHIRFPSSPGGTDVRLRGLKTYNFAEPIQKRVDLRTQPERNKLVLMALVAVLCLVFTCWRLMPARWFVPDDHDEVPTWKIRPLKPPTDVGYSRKHFARHLQSDSSDDTPTSSENATETTVKHAPREPELPPNTTCVNTVQGRDLVTDNTGAICLREHVDVRGCCERNRLIDKLSCKTCRSVVECCESFEYCVSCCLSHEPPARGVVQPVEAFEKCMHTCRTSSRSLKQGNQYRSSFRHCYSESSQPPKNATRKVVVAEQGASCVDACNTADPDLPMICHEKFLTEINDCATMKSYFPCEAGCNTNAGGDQPAYVVNNDKTGTSGQCLINGEPSYFTCDGFHQFTKRLCVCIG